jgi:hypothetical protein
MRNYYPFARRQTVVVPPTEAAVTVTGGMVTTGLDAMATSGLRKTIVQDIMIAEHDSDDSWADQIPPSYAGDGGMLKCRIGIDGGRFLTEDLYDYRVMTDRTRPLCACWDWSMGGRYPYRIYPGQKMSVTMQTTTMRGAVYDNFRSVFFNGVNVKRGLPQHLYALNTEVLRAAPDRVALDGPQMKCPEEGPLDLYSVTHPWWRYGGGTPARVHIKDGTDRPFWDDPQWGHIIDPFCSPILLGPEGWELRDDETLRIELRNGDPNAAVIWGTTPRQVTVTLRGVMEVEDGRK